ncbi:universal stress protein [Natrarchaeobius halalkaliphilus]|uniref:Universal stress protein n=1 Tax=Natrarchaeobius halalkaliphilus TaxID=1679091 RepID=A0A3N6LPB8_9EURY|nr:universal stress protein [Natrarchaeobius halalkaliphilus]RQG89967.1 universal stress protein [Natrarchaeobius halalkaliphilus]
MYQVLLPVDSNEDRAIDAANVVRSLPGPPGDVHVTILNVQKELDVSDGDGNARSEDWYDETDFPPAIDAVKRHLEDDGFVVETRREHTDPAEGIITVAAEIGADQIVMSGRKRTPAGKVLFGSVTQSVLLNAETSVTAVMTDD